jgi:hypothetical protein
VNRRSPAIRPVACCGLISTANSLRTVRRCASPSATRAARQPALILFHDKRKAVRDPYRRYHIQRGARARQVPDGAVDRAPAERDRARLKQPPPQCCSTSAQCQKNLTFVSYGILSRDIRQTSREQRINLERSGPSGRSDELDHGSFYNDNTLSLASLPASQGVPQTVALRNGFRSNQ